MQELCAFTSRNKAVRLVSALRMGALVLREERKSIAIDQPEILAELCSDMRFFDREVLRIALLDAKQHLIKLVTVSQGSLNESLAHPREVFKPVIIYSAYSFVVCGFYFGFWVQEAAGIFISELHWRRLL